MIKYRVYDTEDKEYLDSFRTAVTPDGEVFVLSDYKYNDDGQEIWEAKLVCSARQEPGRFVIEQYTGLKDKNGVEIASGDIVKILYSDWSSKSDNDTRTLEEYMDDISHIRTVVLRRRGFVTNYSEPLDVGPHGFIRVIGNIHENADLLEKTK